ncbi:type IV-A pilus assembly ATPase PilB [Plesiomonas shigelloides]|uniref:type IV-A pilus assembly ATPase PilB n=1 Tax=Plesiomonas shigelloides TaxID=703 RepID=UPI000D13D5E0|nr:type IV-A pilus assembly ATPase PilB [Plesiomonas shigelloides]AVQ87366.1 type IV-A pilus assembly ATPase PilB [Plesiomonas shigelloides]
MKIENPTELKKYASFSSLITKYFALPIFDNSNTLYLGVISHDCFECIDAFRFACGKQIETTLVNKEELREAIFIVTGQYPEDADNPMGSSGLEEDTLTQLEELADESALNDDLALSSEQDEAPIVRFINQMLLRAVRQHASDIHFEPYEKQYRVRFRVDGVLQEIASPPDKLGARLAARLKIMSKLDIAEKRIPQDGRIKLKFKDTPAIDLRVSTLPTLFGEKVVLRILDSSAANLNIDQLGFTDADKQRYLSALAKPQGMILVTGPTGSGKTVTLYTGLSLLNQPERNISTAEDPVEINLAGINQTQINLKAGLTFASALRAFLRQDPDVVMVGEIRDLETAEIAVKAAQTGHLVLSTLHTNSAAETLTRLANMGVPAYNIASSIHLIIAQRLARRLCPECRQPHLLTEAEQKAAGFSQCHAEGLRIFKPKGCPKCTNGYKGRTGLYEIMPITPALTDAILRGEHAPELTHIARQHGMLTLREAGLNKVREGVTSLEEIERVTGV